jgi:hypothetical protein
MVVEATRAPDQHLRTFSYLVDLTAHRLAPDNDRGAKPGMTGKQLKLAADLGGKLAGGLDYQHRWPCDSLAMKTVDERNEKSSRLTAAGFGGGNNIAPTLNQWNCT